MTSRTASSGVRWTRHTLGEGSAMLREMLRDLLGKGQKKIVLNLVFNALKFTPAGGRVELRAEKVGEQFVLTVADTGMGISEQNLPYVFDRFWQADGSSKRKYQGVGIGLAAVIPFNTCLAMFLGSLGFWLAERLFKKPDTAAHRLIERLSEPYDANGREVNISCSVGIALYPDGCEPNKLIARADAAMYAAKRAGRNQVSA